MNFNTTLLVEEYVRVYTEYIRANEMAAPTGFHEFDALLIALGVDVDSVQAEAYNALREQASVRDILLAVASGSMDVYEAETYLRDV